ncbi:hypothetical protein ACFP3U_30825 [Kitasatospora misakiensis]|uniref:Uncharacterized protein n=1 Tax=Kitasatospora misakiensis TaxID=67330 RepID=A0ABW0XFW5_9ACTN
MLAVVGFELALETWWLPAKWHTYDAAASGRMLVSADGRTITLAVEWQCEQEPDLVTRQSNDRVEILLHRKGFKGPTYQCPEGGSARISTHLSAPLASRPLIDAVTNQPVAYVDGHELAKPTYLPPDYDHPDTDPVPYLPGLTQPPAGVPTWTTGYQHGTGAQTGSRLLITQTRGGRDLGPGTAAGHGWRAPCHIRQRLADLWAAFNHLVGRDLHLHRLQRSAGVALR